MLIKYFDNQPHRPGPIWLFDLDNTLHDASYSIFKTLDQRMTEAVMETLGVDEKEAHRLRLEYWRKYGATMIGLCRHHGVNAHEFLARSHDFDIKNQVKFESNLPDLINRLPGTFYVLTNAPCHYAESVLERLRIKQCFRGICAIDHMVLHGQHRPKPSPAMLQQLQSLIDQPRRRHILVEDTLANLRSARKVGWTTIYIHHYGRFGNAGSPRRILPTYMDYRFSTIKSLLLDPRMQRL